MLSEALQSLEPPLIMMGLILHQDKLLEWLPAVLYDNFGQAVGFKVGSDVMNWNVFIAVSTGVASALVACI